MFILFNIKNGGKTATAYFYWKPVKINSQILFKRYIGFNLQFEIQKSCLICFKTKLKETIANICDVTCLRVYKFYLPFFFKSNWSNGNHIILPVIWISN